MKADRLQLVSILSYISGTSHPLLHVDQLGEAAQGLAYLHQNQIVHGDVKGANVLVSRELRALVSDFGLTRAFESAVSTQSLGAGSVRWMSPEVLNGHMRTPQSDVWAFGMMAAEVHTDALLLQLFSADLVFFFQVLSGEVPFYDIQHTPLVILAILHDKKRPRRLPSRSPTGDLYSAAWAFASLCWNDDPAARPPMDRARQGFKVFRSLEAQEPIKLVAFPPDSQTLISISNSHSVRLDRVTEAENSAPSEISSNRSFGINESLPFAEGPRPSREDSTGHSPLIWSLSMSPDGTRVASGFWDNSIRLRDAETGRCVGVLNGHTDLVLCIALSPDGKTLVSGSSDRTVRLWDLSTCTQTGEVLDHQKPLAYSLAFSPNGSTIAVGAMNGSIHLVDVGSGSIKVLAGHPCNVLSVAFSPDGGLLASGFADGSIRIWKIGIPCPYSALELTGHGYWVRSLAFSNDGRWIASGSYDRTVRLWDVGLLPGLR